MRIGSIVSGQDHGFKTHLGNALFFHFKFNLGDDIRLSFLEGNVVKANLHGLVCKFTSNQHLVNFIPGFDQFHAVDEGCQVGEILVKDGFKPIKTSEVEVVKLRPDSLESFCGKGIFDSLPRVFCILVAHNREIDSRPGPLHI